MMTRPLVIWVVICNYGIWCRSKIREFPDYFEFGASTAAYQVEGAWYEDGKGLSIWDYLVHSDPPSIKDQTTGDVAANSYHFYKRDVQVAKELGLNFYRFSISWTRILPKGFLDHINQAGINYYNKLIAELIENNIAPFLTMYHYDLPYTLQKLGGWTNPYIVNWFFDYAKLLLDKFGDRVKFWVTINDPKQICLEGYGSANAAPMLNVTGVGEYLCAKHVLLAHSKVYKLYDESFRKHQNGSIGIAIGFTWYEPASDLYDDNQAATDARQFDWGQYAHPIFSKDGDFPTEIKQNIAFKSAEQGYPKSRLPELSAVEVALIRGSSDFLGVNIYTAKLTYRDASLEGMYPVPSYYDDMASVLVTDPSWPQSQTPWLQEVPWAVTKILMEINKLYDNPPVFITENGWSSTGGVLDDDRIHYLRNCLNAVLDAIHGGCDVRNYAVWSLMDGFEWGSGHSEKFGLYQVDFSCAERTRKPRKSAYIYKEIVLTKALDLNYEPAEFVVLFNLTT